MDSNQGYNPYKWIVCPLTRVINLHITSYCGYPEPLNRLYMVFGFAPGFSLSKALLHRHQFFGCQQPGVSVDCVVVGWLRWLVARETYPKKTQTLQTLNVWFGCGPPPCNSELLNLSPVRPAVLSTSRNVKKTLKRPTGKVTTKIITTCLIGNPGIPINLHLPLLRGISPMYGRNTWNLDGNPSRN